MLGSVGAYVGAAGEPHALVQRTEQRLGGKDVVAGRVADIFETAAVVTPEVSGAQWVGFARHELSAAERRVAGATAQQRVKIGPTRAGAGAVALHARVRFAITRSRTRRFGEDLA